MRYNEAMQVSSSPNVCHDPEHHHFIDKLGTLNGIISGVVLYPQIYVILFLHVQNTLSLPTLLLIVLNNIVWFLYGMHRSVWPTVISAALSAIAGVVLLFI